MRRQTLTEQFLQLHEVGDPPPPPEIAKNKTLREKWQALPRWKKVAIISGAATLTAGGVYLAYRGLRGRGDQLRQVEARNKKQQQALAFLHRREREAAEYKQKIQQAEIDVETAYARSTESRAALDDWQAKAAKVNEMRGKLSNAEFELSMLRSRVGAI